jgi:GGDEF domain-containing protein
MTVPNLVNPRKPEQDPEQAKYEFDLANQQRRELLDEIDRRIQLARDLNSAHIADVVSNSHQMIGQNADGSPTMYQDATTPPSQHELNQLIGAAHYYGIPQPESIEPVHLKSIILQRRLGAQPQDIEHNPLKQGLNVVEQFGASVGLGATEDLIALAQRLPIIGDAVSRMHITQAADQNIAQANEQMVANMTPAQASAFRTASSLGGMVGYALPASAAWTVAGSLGKLGVFSRVSAAITNPLARAAIQGATSSLILEGGGHKSLNQLGETALEGAAAGATFQYLHDTVPRVFEKIRSFFPSQTDPFYPKDYRSGAFGPDANSPSGAQYGRSAPPGESIAEWHYEAATPENQQKLLTGGTEPGRNTAGGPTDPAGTGGFTYQGVSSNPLQPGPRALPPGPIDADFEVIPRQEQLSAAFGRNAGNELQQATLGQTAPTPQAESVPGPYGKLMSPERADMQARLDGVVEQRDIARRLLETDQLTGQGNRAALMRVRDQIDADPQMSWALFDGKQFKAVNDNLGHDVGDGVLQNFGGAIQQAAAEMNIPARIFRQGGDEFSAVVPKEHAPQFVQRVKELSFQRVNGIETQLDGFHADSFGEADLNLMQNKRQIPETITGVALQDKSTGQIISKPGFEGGHSSLVDVSVDMEGQYNGGFITSKGRYVGRQEGLALAKQARQLDRNNPRTAIANELGELYAETLTPFGKPDNVPTLNKTDAVAEAATLTKHTTLLEGSDVGQLAGQSAINVADVAQAALAKNPAGVTVIRGVGDAGQTIRDLVQGQTQQKMIPSRFRLIKRGESMDLMITNGEGISNQKARQYEETGLFEGMHATVDGNAVVVRSADAVSTIVQDPITGEIARIATANVMPGTTAAPVDVQLPNAEKLYTGFRSYALDQMRNVQQTMGITEPLGWLSHETSTQLPRMLDDYLAQQGFTDPISRAAAESYFNVRRVADFRATAPEEAEQLATVVKELNAMAGAKNVELPIHDIAVTKGFDYVPTPGEAGGTLVDRLSDLRVPVDSPEAGYEFVRNFNREVPDYTPVSEVPAELMSAGPYAANPGYDLEPVAADQHQLHYSSATNQINQINSFLNAANPTGAGSGASGAPNTSRYTPNQANLGGAGTNYIPPAGSPPAGVSPPPGSPPAATPPSPTPPAKARTLGQALQQESTRQPLGHLLQELDSAWLRWFEPFRRATIRIQDFLGSINIPEGKLHQQYYNLVTAIDIKHNFEHPWLSEATDIHDSYTKRIWQRNGTTMWAATLQNGMQRQAYMQAAGFSNTDMLAQDRMIDFFDRFFTARGATSREVFDYIGDVAARQAMPTIADPFKDMNGRLTPQTKFVESLAKERNMQFRKMDSRVFTTSLVREAFYLDHVKPHFDAMATTWRDPLVQKHAPGLYNIVDKWLDNVRYGYNPDWDAAVQGIRYTLNKFGVPVNDAEVVNFWNGIYSQFYRGAIGGRAAPIFRDAVSPFLGAVRIGTAPVAKTYGAFLTNPTARNAMWQRALQGGWLTEGMVRVPNADAFEAVVQNPQFQPQIPQSLVDRREQLARIGDIVYEFTPKYLRGGIQGTMLDPMLPYTKLNEMLRVVTGEAGYQEADKAINAYQTRLTSLQSGQIAITGTNVIRHPVSLRILTAPGELVEAQDVISAQDHFLKNLMDESHADAYPKSIQDEFKGYIQDADWEGAKRLLANEAANSQMRYGQKEAPIGIRQAGQFGRMGMMLGSFSNQYVGAMREMFTDPAIPTLKKVAMAQRMGIYQGIIGAAGIYSGWSFNKWLWHHSLTFGGGPFATGLADTFEANTGRIAEALGENLSPMQTDALARARRTSVGEDIGNFLGGLNPYRSTIREFNDLANIASGPGPNSGEQFARRLITNDRGLSIDINQTLNQQRVVTPDDIEGAIAGNAESLTKFTPREQQFLPNLRNVPRASRYQVWQSYQNQAVEQYNRNFRDSVAGAGNRQ